MSAPTFTPHQLRTQFEGLVTDTYDVTHTYQLLTQAKNYIERMMKLYILQDSDASQTANVGDTYTTAKTLAANCREVISLFVGIIPYTEVPYAQRVRYKDSSRRFYINWKEAVQGSNGLYLCGKVGSAQIITQNILVATGALTEANEDTVGVVLWPDEFQPIIPYVAARIFQANIDPDDIAIRQSIAQDNEMQRLYDAFVAWDHDIKLAAMDHRAGFADDENDVPFDVGTL